MTRPLLQAWSDQDVTHLKELWLEGLSATEIGLRLGRTRNSVLGYVDRNRDVFGRRDDATTVAAESKKARVARQSAAENKAVREPRKATARVASLVASPQMRSADAEDDLLPRSLPHGWTIIPGTARDLSRFVVPGREPVRFAALGSSQCHFPLAVFDARDGAGTPCCGAETKRGESWCADHRRLVWRRRA